MVYEKIKEIIVAQFQVDPDKIQLETYFAEDLEADSIDVMELVNTFEEEFNKEITDEELGSIKQVKDVVRYFEGH
ncbi:MAG: acyl carrier protein [Eubacteriaceae bacterium]|nr:acyl carrier protein [Eubacteriaceae bacterium]